MFRITMRILLLFLLFIYLLKTIKEESYNYDLILILNILFVYNIIIYLLK